MKNAFWYYGYKAFRLAIYFGVWCMRLRSIHYFRTQIPAVANSEYISIRAQRVFFIFHAMQWQFGKRENRLISARNIRWATFHCCCMTEQWEHAFVRPSIASSFDLPSSLLCRNPKRGFPMVIKVSLSHRANALSKYKLIRKSMV